MSKHIRFARLRRVLLAVFIGSVVGSAHASTLTGAALVNALRHGGYVLVMRHASSLFAAPDKSAANPDNPRFERQLDETGRSTAGTMGEAIKQLRIRVGDVFSSPTYRALESVRIAALGQPKTYAELDEGAQGMQSGADPQKSAWLRAKAVAQKLGGDEIEDPAGCERQRAMCSICRERRPIGWYRADVGVSPAPSGPAHNGAQTATARRSETVARP